MTAARAPRDLKRRGAAFWRTVVGGFELTESETQLLHEACRTLDEIDALRDVIAAEGSTVKGSTGQPRAHPAYNELRSHRAMLSRLLVQLALPDDAGGVMPTPASSRAAKAAHARWSRTQRPQEHKHGGARG